MEITITRLDKTLPMPAYQTSGAVAFDLYARVTTVLEPKTIALIPSNLIIATPPGYALIIASRSSTPRKKGLSAPSGIGIVDQDFCGPQDEVCIQVYNFTDAPVTVERGERIAQALFVPAPHVTFKEQEIKTTESRGGFGSTGAYVSLL